MEETHLSTKQAASMVDRIAQATFYDEKESGNDHKGSYALFGVAEYLERIIEKEQDTIFKVMQMNNAVKTDPVNV